MNMCKECWDPIPDQVCEYCGYCLRRVEGKAAGAWEIIGTIILAAPFILMMLAAYGIWQELHR